MSRNGNDRHNRKVRSWSLEAQSRTAKPLAQGSNGERGAIDGVPAPLSKGTGRTDGARRSSAGGCGTPSPYVLVLAEEGGGGEIDGAGNKGILLSSKSRGSPSAKRKPGGRGGGGGIDAVTSWSL